MKNLIIAAITIFLGTTVQVKATNTDDKPSANAKVINERRSGFGIVVDIDFGRRKRNCTGFGICRITISTDVDQPSSPGGKFNSNGNGTLTLTIPVEYIKSTQPDKMKNFTGQTAFIVEEDYTLPQEVSKQFGSESTLTIKAGTYAMTLRDGLLTVIIGDML